MRLAVDLISSLALIRKLFTYRAVIFDSRGIRIALAQGFHSKLLSAAGSSEWQQLIMRNQF